MTRSGDASITSSASALFNRFDLATSANVGWRNGSSSQRVGMRLGTALAITDGHLGFGRPVNDSFAIISAHKSLGNRKVLIGSRATDANALAKSDRFGPALLSDWVPIALVSSTSELRTPPIGYDLGTGTFRVLPPLFGGYHFVVGSQNANLVVGSLLLESGAPAALVVGLATSADWPQAEPMTIFTNASGQFSISSLGPGRWSIKLRGVQSVYRFDVTESTSNLH